MDPALFDYAAFQRHGEEVQDLRRRLTGGDALCYLTPSDFLTGITRLRQLADSRVPLGLGILAREAALQLSFRYLPHESEGLFHGHLTTWDLSAIADLTARTPLPVSVSVEAMILTAQQHLTAESHTLVQALARGGDELEHHRSTLRSPYDEVLTPAGAAWELRHALPDALLGDPEAEPAVDACNRLAMLAGGMQPGFLDELRMRLLDTDAGQRLRDAYDRDAGQLRATDGSISDAGALYVNDVSTLAFELLTTRTPQLAQVVAHVAAEERQAAAASGSGHEATAAGLAQPAIPTAERNAGPRRPPGPRDARRGPR